MYDTASSGNAKPKILYVEDDQTLAMLYVTRLQIEGFDVRQCLDSGQAVQAALDFRPDLILMDLMMPRLSGYDVLGALRANPQTAGTKIIIMSALSQPEAIEKAKQLGAADYLVKSQVLIDDVIDRIRSHLGLHSSGTATPNELD